MSSLTDLQENLEGLQTARFVTTMLRDISANDLQNIRAEFEKNTAFYKEMSDLDAIVQAYRGQRDPKVQSRKKERGNAFVALTSNKRFSGTINKEIMERLIDRMERGTEGEYVVIGSTGRDYLKDTKYANGCIYLEFADDKATPEETLSLIKRLAVYEQVFVYHPTFINAFRQEVALIDITHRSKSKQVIAEEMDYIFEPDISELLKFFETQVSLILFNRVLIETRLAQTGARLTKMQHARDQAGELVKEERRIIHKELSAIQSMRLLETFAGFQK